MLTENFTKLSHILNTKLYKFALSALSGVALWTKICHWKIYIWIKCVKKGSFCTIVNRI